MYIVKIDDYYGETDRIDFPYEMTYGSSLKIYIDKNGEIINAVNGYGDKEIRYIGRKVEVFQKLGECEPQVIWIFCGRVEKRIVWRDNPLLVKHIICAMVFYKNL